MASKACYAFSLSEVLWKNIVITKYQGDFKFQGDWRKTYVFESHKIHIPVDPPIQIHGLFSDTLYNEWYCSQINPSKWAQTEFIERRSNLSIEEFIEKYEKPNIPVIITDIVPQWEAYKKWNKEYLNSKFGNIKFKTDAQLEFTLENYLQYSGNNHEERSIYLFDDSFGSRAPEMLKEYEVPKYFPVDFFNLLTGKKDECGDDIRPHFRWLLVGPVRAGATFHKDPNYTSAWHGLIYGKKKWIMFPPEVTPQGVIPSLDEQDVTVPSTMIQWYLDFYHKKPPMKPIECTLKGGEMIFIPSGWWHSVINIEESYAITQNYVNENNLKRVCDFIKTKKRKQLYYAFEEVMKQHHPQLWEKCNDGGLKEKEKTNFGGTTEDTMTWEDVVGDGDSDEEWTLSV
eukprot:TRINITY_DN6673_c0_g1_i1.p1 TRINITY_DN6673_c0_g1~~TRINITY_DN6673_c0_g1_i1.p1  ORF type:complete len:399 (+),score=116.35 TRINITY_DN6673_c0_g1_i1:60-1256(+)